jgi:diacylglycerol O-acyltransferase
MKPLEGIDAAFLSLETPTTPLHVAAVLVLDPPEGRRSLFSPSTRFSQIRRLVEQRLHLVPQLRQRVLRVPFGLQHPVWVDDPEFDLDDHLSRASVPAPGGRRELDHLIADTMSRPLDPERPLWEMVVVEGLAHGRSALVAKLHHAILDGVSGASVLAAFLDLSPRERIVAFPEPFDPEPLPTSGDLLRYAARSMGQQPGALVDAVTRGMEVVAGLTDQRQGTDEEEIGSVPRAFSAPRTSLNGSVSMRRRFASVSAPLEDAKLIRRVFGGSVNDVILASVAGGVRRLLLRRGEDPAGALVALVPVSTRRGEAGRSALGNKVSGMLVSLATNVEDPVERLQMIRASSRAARARERIRGGHLLEDIAQVTPPAVASRVVRWASGLGVFDRLPPAFNLTVSSVKGPPGALWCAGSRVDALYPVGPVAEGAGLNVTTMTYLGQLHFGILGCRRLAPDVQDLAIMVDDSMAELAVVAAEAQRSAS